MTCDGGAQRQRLIMAAMTHGLAPPNVYQSYPGVAVET